MQILNGLLNVKKKGVVFISLLMMVVTPIPRSRIAKLFSVNGMTDPKKIRFLLYKVLGLPEPSLQIDTGGKSIHNYWILKKSIEPKTWKPIQERLLDHADADRALKNPSRVMRLPGTYHMNEDGTAGGLTTIIHNSEKNYP
jgi:hypothetical protein